MKAWILTVGIVLVSGISQARGVQDSVRDYENATGLTCQYSHVSDYSRCLNYTCWYSKFFTCYEGRTERTLELKIRSSNIPGDSVRETVTESLVH